MAAIEIIAGNEPPQNAMGTRPVNRLLLSMAIPMMFAMLVQSLYNIVDRIFVARLGETALAAVSLTFPLQMLLLHISVGTGVGVNALLSKSLGERNFALVRRSALNGLFLGVLTSLVFVSVAFWGVDFYFQNQKVSGAILAYGRDYLRLVCLFSFTLVGQVLLERLLMSTGKVVCQMISQIAGALINLALDPIMIFGLFGCPRLEVAGAAVATVIGEAAAMLLALYFNLRKNKEIDFSLKGFRPDWAVLGRIYSVGIPSILLGALGSVMVYGLNRILLGTAASASAVAVLGVYFGLQSFIFMPVFGLNNALIPIVAFNFGARQKRRIWRAIELSCLYAVGLMTLGLLIFQIFPAELLRLFNATPQMLAVGVPALRIISAHYIFAALCIEAISVFQALGHGLESLCAAAFRQLALLLPAAWLLSLLPDANAIWWSFPLAEIGSLIMVAALIQRVYARQIRPLPD
ncbi:MAG: MATE family efflux transporter [Candidatus Margulisbacteria bacterium]|jgi:putative MATE family efflux protein|nr:MATE family efflux transporter [Candidatus Margulisiibacteriota bacterium]